MLIDVMGHNTGWLSLSAGIAGGADVILIPEIPYRLESIYETLKNRREQGKRFSIVVVAEGARAKDYEVITQGDGEVGRSEKILGG